MSDDNILIISVLLAGVLIGSSMTTFIKARLNLVQRPGLNSVQNDADKVPLDKSKDPKDSSNNNNYNDNDDEEEDSDDDDSDINPMEEELKMMIVVNMGLKMSKGKMVAQCCHGCLGAYRKASPGALKAWSSRGQAKITLKAPDDKVAFYALLLFSVTFARIKKHGMCI